MTTWRDEALAIIGNVHNSLPVDADLKARQKALKDARPYWFKDTSWGRKVWQSAQRQYLEKFGLKPRGADKLPESPLERLMRRGSA